MTVLLFAMPALRCFGQGHQRMQPGVNFRVTDKNVEQPVVVKDAGPPAILPSASCLRMTPYLRIPTGDQSRFGSDSGNLVAGPIASEVRF
jgi:hypothetical protein